MREKSKDAKELPLKVRFKIIAFLSSLFLFHPHYCGRYRLIYTRTLAFVASYGVLVFIQSTFELPYLPCGLSTYLLANFLGIVPLILVRVVIYFLSDKDVANGIGHYLTFKQLDTLLSIADEEEDNKVVAPKSKQSKPLTEVGKRHFSSKPNFSNLFNYTRR